MVVQWLVVTASTGLLEALLNILSWRNITGDVKCTKTHSLSSKNQIEYVRSEDRHKGIDCIQRLAKVDL